MNNNEEIHELGKMLTATTCGDVSRLLSIAKRIMKIVGAQPGTVTEPNGMVHLVSPESEARLIKVVDEMATVLIAALNAGIFSAPVIDQAKAALAKAHGLGLQND